MWPLVTFTLCFRGLMVIHRVETVNPNYFEVGVVKDDDHFLRINTIRNGVLAETKFFKKEEIPDGSRWALEVDNPVGSGVSIYTQGAPGQIDRERHAHERDFRWITELSELFEEVEEKIDTTRFLPILRIPHGIFSTRAKSADLVKIVDGEVEPFGPIAAVVACDIPMIAGSRVRLVAQGGGTLFTFEPDEKTIYEFANTPAEVPHQGGPRGGHMHEDDNNDPCKDEHFKRYYKLFKDPDAEPSICFKKVGAAPAPDPATCGATGGGTIKGPFGGG